MPAEPDFLEVLAHLAENEVELILVGGVAAILHGAPIMTEDLDFVYRSESQNLERLAAALRAIDAIYRDPAGRRIRPTAARLARNRVNLLTSSLGPVDALRTIGDDLDYAALVEHAEWFEIEGVRFRVLDLETIIESKLYANRPKDRATLPFLQAVLRMREKKAGT